MLPSFIEWAAARGAVRDRGRILHYGDPQAEYHAARNRVALFDRAGRGRLRISGADALDVLHRTTTQDMKGLGPGRGAATVLQTETARVLDWVFLWVFADHLLAVTGEDRAAADRDWIDRVVIMDDVTVEDVTDRTALYEIAGPLAPETAAVLAGGDTASLGPWEHRTFTWNGLHGRLARGRAATPDSFWLLIEEPRETATRRGGAPGASERGDAVMALAEAGLAIPAGCLASESFRIEQGQPLPGRELTEETNPLEAGLQDAIGFSKGCYTGQEVIARMITYKSLKRTLAGVEFDDVAPSGGGDTVARRAGAGGPGAGRTTAPLTGPEPGESFPIVPEGLVSSPGAVPAPDAIARSAVGRLTSAAWSFGLGRTLGLGILTLEAARPGTPLLVITAAGPVPARSASLPFIP